MVQQTITSRQNPLIKHIVSLQEIAYRRLHKQFIAEGIRACTTLCKSGVPLLYLLYTKEQETAIVDLFAQNYICLSDELMQKISATTTPSGLLGVYTMPTNQDSTTLGAGLVLANIQNPGNMGTLIRTAAAIGVTSIVLVEGTDLWNPKVVQASAGTIGMVTFFELSWTALLEAKKNIPLCALVISGGNYPESIDLKKHLLVVGNEAHGIPGDWIKDCDTKVTLAMPGGTESLNAAIAGSIALYVGYTNTR